MEPYKNSNFHTHTSRCKHAFGTEREFIEAAIAYGMKTLGFSDHVPCPFSDGYVSNIRMDMEQVEDYVSTLKALREEYKGKMEILIGFEVEYIPEYFEKQMEYFKPFGIDYLIMGQHFYEPNEKTYTGAETTDERVLKSYVDSVLLGMQTGRFMYLAHPDLINYLGDKEIYNREMTRMCRGLKEMDIPLEVNVLGFRGGRHYPSERFFKIAADIGNPIVIAMDAHNVMDLTDRRSYMDCRYFIQQLGVTNIVGEVF